MAPIDYISRTREMYAGYAAYRWVVSTSAPWTPLRKPVSESTVGLVTSGGIHMADQEPFHIRDDTSLREIPKDARTADMRVRHFGYLTDDARDDPNCVFPLERMRELETDGVIGELLEPAYSFMGGIYSVRRIHDELCPDLLSRLESGRVDLLFLVPA